MSTRARLARTAISTMTWLAMIVCVVCTGLAMPARADIVQFETPTPITSSDLERLASAAGLGPQERIQLDAAFDAYVEGWQRLRTGTLRPLRLDVAALLAERLAAQPNWEAIQSMPPEQQEEAYRVAGEQASTVAEATAARAVTLRDRANAAYRSMGQLEEPVFAALRQGDRTEEQREAVSLEAARRARRLAGYRIRSVTGNGLGVTTPLPGVQRPGEDPVPPEAVRALGAFVREAAPSIEAIAEAVVSEGPQGENARALRAAFATQQLDAIEKVTALLPEEDRAAWRRRARGRLLFGSAFIMPAPTSESLLTMMGDRANAPARTRMDGWFQQRERLENALLTAGDETGDARRAIVELDQAARAELAEMTRTPGLADGTTNFSGLMELVDPTNPEDASDLFNQPGYMASMGQDLMGDPDDEPAESRDPMAAQRRMLEVPAIDRRTIDAIRDRLGIAAEQRAVWEALVDDLIDDCQAIAATHQVDPTGMQDPRAGIEALRKLRDHRAALAARETQWFDDLQTGIAGLDPKAVSDERSRRDLQRLQRTSGWILLSLKMTGNNRWMDVDLDSMTESLTPQERALIAGPLAAWRAQKTREIGDLVNASDEMMNRLGKFWENAKIDDLRMEDMMRIQGEWMERCRTICRRAEAAQTGDIATMAAALPEAAGRRLQRAARRMLYPEVHRPQERIDRMVETAITLPDLSPEQLTALGEQADAYRLASDAIAERMIAALETADAARADMMQSMQTMQEAGGQQAMMARAAAMQTTQLASSDLAFDRAELDARTRRRFKALLTPEQAVAAGLD